MHRPSRYDRFAVYLCRPNEAFKPTRGWDFPQEILAARLYRKRLAMADALSFARIHNAGEMRKLYEGKQPIAEWAMVVHYLRPQARSHGRPRKGGRWFLSQPVEAEGGGL